MLATERSPYIGDKVRQIFSEFLKEEEAIDEFSPPAVDPTKFKTYFISEGMSVNFSLIPTDTEALVFPPCSSDCIGTAWSEFPPLPKSLKVIDLGHDGVIWGIRDNTTKSNKWSDETACRAVLKSLPNLEKVYYCGYYSLVDLEKIAKDFPNITFEPIY